jgi:hypothetical protein
VLALVRCPYSFSRFYLYAASEVVRECLRFIEVVPVPCPCATSGAMRECCLSVLDRHLQHLLRPFCLLYPSILGL